jgi:membrane-associated protein
MFDLFNLIEQLGYLGLFLIIFAESGFFLGWFLPGDSLLFTAGILSSLGYLHIVPVIILCFLGAVLGDSFGYWFGKKVGHRIFTRDDSLFLNKKHIHRAEDFFAKHGNKTIVIARFLPVIRTMAPILAGVGHMHYGTFLIYNLIGAVIWAIGLPVLGYYLGNAVPNIEHYILPAILIIVFVSILPTAIQLLSNEKHRHRIKSLFRKSKGQ